MKKEKVKKAILILVGGIVLLFIVGVFVSQSEDVPAFKFLEGRGGVMKVKEDSGISLYRQTFYISSFEGDFEDVCANAQKELSGLGYRETTLSVLHRSSRREFRLVKSRGNSIRIQFLKDYIFSVYVGPRIREKLIPDQHSLLSRKRWISVEITEVRRQNRFVYQTRKLIKRIFP